MVRLKTGPEGVIRPTRRCLVPGAVRESEPEDITYETLGTCGIVTTAGCYRPHVPGIAASRRTFCGCGVPPNPAIVLSV